MRDLGHAAEAVLHRPGPELADAGDVVELVDGGPQDLLEVSEAVDDGVDHRLGQPRDAREQPEAAGRHPHVEVRRAVRQVHRGGDPAEVDQLVVRQVRQGVEGLGQVPVAGLVEVVAHHEAAVVADAAHELLELEPDQAAVVAQLDDVALDLGRDAGHHLVALEHGDHVAQGDEVLDLEGREGDRHLVEPGLVALEGLHGLVGPGDDPGHGVDLVLLVADVDADHVHAL